MKRLISCVLFCSCAVLSAQVAHPPTATQPSGLAEIQALIDRGHLDEAYTALQPFAAQRPEPAGVERLRGKILYLKNDLPGADAALAAAVAQHPADREAAEMRGVVLYRMGKAAEAVPLLQNAHGTIPGTNVDGAYAYALCLIEVHRFDEARHVFATLYAFPPDSYSSYVLAAHMFLRWSAHAAAQEAASKALVLNPHASEAHMVLGLIALGAGNLDEARTQFKQEIVTNPVSGQAYEHLGDALMRKQMYAEAQETLNRAILLEPNSTGPFILLGQDLIKAGKPGLAVSYLQHAEQMDPSNILTHTTLMQAYRMTGDRDAAGREAKTAQALQAKH